MVQFMEENTRTQRQTEPFQKIFNFVFLCELRLHGVFIGAPHRRTLSVVTQTIRVSTWTEGTNPDRERVESAASLQPSAP